MKLLQKLFLKVINERHIILLFIFFQINIAKPDSILQNSNVWLYTVWSPEGNISCYSYFINDTIINNNSYKIFRIQNVTIPGLIANPWFNGYGDIYLRYDSISDIVYKANSTSEDTLYNYNMNIADTLGRNNNPFVLTTKDSVQMEDLSYRQRFVFTDSSNDSIIWLKGIGNIALPFDQYRVYSSDFLLCYHQNQTLIYQYQDLVPIQCDNFSPVNEISNSIEISIYPNPFEDYVSVNSKDKIKELEIYNMSGQKLISIKNNENNLQINLSKFATGIYYFKFILINEEVFFRKVSKEI
jgi:hypothetical protein